MRKFLFCLIFNFFIVTNAYSEDASTKAIDNYVDNLVKDVSNILNDLKLTQDNKVVKIRALILTNLDLDWMAKYTLGNYRRTLSPEQINKFIEVYSKYVSMAYSNLVKDYKGQEGKVIRTRPLDKEEFIVEMAIVGNQGQQPIKVEYLVRQIKNTKGNYNSLKVSDVITEGVSLINSQQGEFERIISNDGFDKLVEELAKRS